MLWAALGSSKQHFFCCWPTAPRRVAPKRAAPLPERTAKATQAPLDRGDDPAQLRKLKNPRQLDLVLQVAFLYRV